MRTAYQVFNILASEIDQTTLRIMDDQRGIAKKEMRLTESEPEERCRSAFVAAEWVKSSDVARFRRVRIVDPVLASSRICRNGQDYSASFRQHFDHAERKTSD